MCAQTAGGSATIRTTPFRSSEQQATGAQRGSSTARAEEILPSKHSSTSTVFTPTIQNKGSLPTLVPNTSYYLTFLDQTVQHCIYTVQRKVFKVSTVFSSAFSLCGF